MGNPKKNNQYVMEWLVRDLFHTAHFFVDYPPEWVNYSHY